MQRNLKIEAYNLALSKTKEHKLIKEIINSIEVNNIKYNNETYGILCCHYGKNGNIEKIYYLIN